MNQPIKHSDIRNQTSRSEWVDHFRGICIIFVVIGHVLGGLLYSNQIESKEYLKNIYTWIYSFHMPAFFWVSGLFAYQTYQKLGLARFIGNKAATLYYPYILWGILGWLIHVSLEKYTNTPANHNAPYTLLWNPTSGPWFLIVLFLLMVIAGVLFQLKIKGPIILLIVMLCWIIEEYAVIPIPIILFDYAAKYGIYFALGIAIGPFVLRKVSTLSPSNSLVLFLVGLTLFVVSLLIHFEVHPAFRALPAMLAFVWLVGISKLIPNRRALNWLPLCGRYSLQIYLLHAYPTVLSRIILIRLFHIHNITAHVVINSTVGIAACLGVAILLTWAVLDWLFRFPKRKHSANAIRS